MDTSPQTESTRNESSFDVEAKIFLYRDTHFYRIATILGTLVSSLIRIAAIIILSLVRNMTVRLGVVCAVTAIFSVCLSLVTEAKRSRILRQPPRRFHLFVYEWRVLM